MKNLIFTICSFNYLGQALTLGDSIKKTNPDYKFVIGLVDRIEDRKHMLDGVEHEVMEIEDMNYEGFEEMCTRYNIVELNTAVKPYFAEYLMNKYPDYTTFSYMDPDMKIFQSLSPLEEALSKNNIVLTPHRLSSPPDQKTVSEYKLFTIGIFNLGFIGMSKSEETIRFLRWWQEKLFKECIYDHHRNLNVDQGWITLAPCYFDGVLSWRHKGANIAYWNLHERVVTKNENGGYTIGDDPLIFFHFSNYKPSFPDEIKHGLTEMTFEKRPDVVELFRDYHEELMTNRFFEFKSQDCRVPIKSMRRIPIKEVLKNRAFSTIDKILK